jgi:TPR repeat protein
MRRWSPVLLSLLLAVTLSIAPAAAAREPDAASARQATQQGNWPQALADWHELYIKGDPDAPGQLCRLYFDGRQGEFAAARVVDWCRQAAGKGDADGLYRMGLLYLVGLGVGQDVDQAQALCAAAVQRGKPVPAGFCLAAARAEKAQAARETLQLPAAPAPAPAMAAQPGGSPAQQCDRAFTATPFDTPAAAAACGKAAGDGDAEARYRLGLMRLLGVPGPRDLDLAEDDCRSAGEAAGAHPAAVFCLEAVAQLRQAAASLAISRHTGAIDVDPTTGGVLPKTDTSPFAVDRVLDEARQTTTGLSYTCRQVTQWALYEMPGLVILQPSDSLFGRQIIDYRPADFAALERLADECTKATAAVDADGSLRRQFATFRRSIRALETSQAELHQQRLVRRDEAAAIKSVEQAYRTSHLTMAIYSPQEQACIRRVKQSWRASGRDTGHRALEISASNRESENGRFVAYGVANVVETDSTQRGVLSISMYRCTFDKGDDSIANFQLSPDFASAN